MELTEKEIFDKINFVTKNNINFGKEFIESVKKVLKTIEIPPTKMRWANMPISEEYTRPILLMLIWDLTEKNLGWDIISVSINTTGKISYTLHISNEMIEDKFIYKFINKLLSKIDKINNSKEKNNKKWFFNWLDIFFPLYKYR